MTTAPRPRGKGRGWGNAMARRRPRAICAATAREAVASDFIDLDDPEIRIAVRRSAAARRLSLTVSSIDGRARLTLPARCARRAAERFLDQNREWLRRALAHAPAIVPLEPGAQAPFRGALLTVLGENGRRGVAIDLGAGVIRVGGRFATAGAQIQATFREAARARLLERVRVHAATLGVEFERIVIRDTRSRWGSCSSTGTLSFSWRLIMAPDDVLDYVAAHEVAHLLEMNHSQRFWAHVERLRPDWRAQREWLRLRGAELHRFRLAD